MPTPRMRSGIRACCRLEKRAARHRAPSIDPALKPFTLKRTLPDPLRAQVFCNGVPAELLPRS